MVTYILWGGSAGNQLKNKMRRERSAMNIFLQHKNRFPALLRDMEACFGSRFYCDRYYFVLLMTYSLIRETPVYLSVPLTISVGALETPNCSTNAGSYSATTG